MKAVKRVFSVAIVALMIIVLAGILSFYILIVAGASPTLQTMWICSAMRTMSHKYFATMFFSDTYIEKIMSENEIDDTGYDSEILSFGKGGNTETKPPVTETEIETESETETETEAESETETETETETEPESESDTETETETETEPAPESDSKLVFSEENGPVNQLEEGSGDYESEGYTLLETGLYVKEVSGTGWRGYVMLVEDPLRVKLVDTSQQYSCGENVMTMVKNSGAVAGINGGGFQDGANYDSNGGTPAGLLIEDRALVYPYVTDETVYNMIGINGEGALVLRHCTADWALENDIVSAVSFSPFIVVNGEGLIKNGTGGWGIAPRTAIGQRKTGEFLLLVIDGRQADWSIGCDLDVLQQVMLDENAYNAAMLDGGSSTAMVYNSEYINRPSLGHERWINNCFVVMPEDGN